MTRLPRPPGLPGRPVLLRWLVVVVGTAAGSVVLELVGAPSPELFAGVLVGLVVALRSSERTALPRGVGQAAQAVLGVAVGTLVTTETLSGLGGDAVPVVLVCLATLVLSVLTGLLLTRVARVDTATASFGMVAGGASGVVAIARELGADQRLVAVMQYLRVLVVVATAPLVAELFPRSSSGGTIAAADPPGLLPSLVFLLGAVGLGLALSRVARLPAGSLLGPLVVASVAAASGLEIAGPLPDAFQALAFAVIGLQVGLSFTAAALRHARSLLVPVLAMIVLLVLACAGLGALLSWATGASALDGYLATTPGGLYAVIAASVGAGSDTTFVLAVQVLRLLVMLLAAPLLGSCLARRR